jgi:hypothetical protein
MDPKVKSLVDTTNLTELVRPASNEVILNQPVETSSPRDTEPARSTYDPLQANFASVDIAGKLLHSNTGSGTKAFALVFLGVPAIALGLGLIFLAWASPDLGLMGKLIFSFAGLAIAGFWPYMALSKRYKKSRRS